MSKNSIRIWIIVSGLLAIGVAPFLAQGDQATRQRIEQNRQAIANMTLSERDHLERNFAAYQKKTPQELASLQAFHQVIEEDRQTNAGELTKALNQYDQWLATIEPFQRDQLKETADPQQRLKLMSEIVREQKYRHATSFFRRLMQDSPLADVPALNREELFALTEKIENLESNRITDIQRSELNRKEGIARTLQLLQILKANSPFRPQDKSPRWVTRDLFRTWQRIESQYSSLIQNEEVKNYLAQERDGSREVPVVLRIQSVILKSMILQTNEQQNRSSIPKQDQLEELFVSLPEEEQDQLLHLEAIEFYNELVERFDRPDEEDEVTLRDVSEVFDFFKRPHEDQGRWPPGKRPPGDRDGRPGDGPGDRERDGFRGERGGPGRSFRGDGGSPPRDDRRDERPPE